MKRLSNIPLGVFLLLSLSGFGSAVYADVWADHMVFQVEIRSLKPLHRSWNAPKYSLIKHL